MGSIIKSTACAIINDQPLHQISAQCTRTLPASLFYAIDISQYGSLQKLLAVTVYVLCFIDATQQLQHSTGHLTLSELSRARLKWLHHDVFPEEIANLQPQSCNHLPTA